MMKLKDTNPFYILASVGILIQGILVSMLPVSFSTHSTGVGNIFNSVIWVFLIYLWSLSFTSVDSLTEEKFPIAKIALILSLIASSFIFWFIESTSVTPITLFIVDFVIAAIVFMIAGKIRISEKPETVLV